MKREEQLKQKREEARLRQEAYDKLTLDQKIQIQMEKGLDGKQLKKLLKQKEQVKND